MMLNVVIVDVGSIQGPKVVYSKEAEARWSILFALENAWKNSFVRLQSLVGYSKSGPSIKWGAMICPLTQLL